MKQSISITLASAVILAVATLFGFQNCSGPEPTIPLSSNSTPAPNVVPGGANGNSDLVNTGTSPVTVAVTPTAPPGSLPSSQFIGALYHGLLQRPPSATELSTWEGFIGLGYGCTYIAQQVLASAEYTALVAKLPAATFVVDLYTGLLGRQPSQPEQAQAVALAGSYPNNAAAAVALSGDYAGSAAFKAYCSQFENMQP